MSKKILCHVLLLLIALQSVLAVADIHQNHQTVGKHVESQVDHAHGENAAQAGGDVDDYHHCCHCHASTIKLIASPSLFPLAQLSSERMLEYDYQISTPQISSLYRPPRV